MARGLALPVADTARTRAGKNKEQCEALQASNATMFLTGRVKNPEVMHCDFGIFSEGDYPPNDAIFFLLALQKNSCHPLR